MQQDIIKIDSISQLHQLGEYGKPVHPLISILNFSELEIKPEQVGIRSCVNMFVIGLKDKSCGNQYGRNTYDFDEGVLFFNAPGQVQAITEAHKKGEVNGWMIVFHADLIRNMPLGQKIDQYNFFSYSVYEALHLSEEEQISINNCMSLIKKEISARIDNHSQTVIASSLELMLNLSQRYYERQFNTRSAQNSDIVSQFEQHLKAYYEAGSFVDQGFPSVKYFADKMNLSASYLSDLLKKATSLNAKEHINHFVIDKSKTLLLSKTASISEIAYELGFNYPHYFSRLFKSKTGQSPLEYRQLN